MLELWNSLKITVRNYPLLLVASVYCFGMQRRYEWCPFAIWKQNHFFLDIRYLISSPTHSFYLPNVFNCRCENGRYLSDCQGRYTTSMKLRIFTAPRCKLPPLLLCACEIISKPKPTCRLSFQIVFSHTTSCFDIALPVLWSALFWLWAIQAIMVMW